MEKDSNINLLLDCLGRKSSAEVAERLCGASNEVWRQPLELAWQSGLGPLFYSRVKVLLSDNKIPPEITKQLRHIYIENTARNTLFYHELSNILEAFNKVNIPVILLKGAYLAEKIYEAVHLALWLNRHKERPEVESNRDDTPFLSITSKEKMHVTGKR